MRKLRTIIGVALFSVVVCRSIGHSAVRLAWDYTQGTTLATEFIVYKQPSCTGAFTAIATVPMATKTYTDVSVVPGATYCWEVSARSATGEESAFSNVLTFRVPFPPPAQPTNLSGTIVP